MSMGWAGLYKEPEAIHGGLVRVRKGSYLHLPMIKLDYRNKQEFMDRVEEIAESLWNKMEETKMKISESLKGKNIHQKEGKNHLRLVLVKE